MSACTASSPSLPSFLFRREMLRALIHSSQLSVSSHQVRPETLRIFRPLHHYLSWSTHLQKFAALRTSLTPSDVCFPLYFWRKMSDGTHPGRL